MMMLKNNFKFTFKMNDENIAERLIIKLENSTTFINKASIVKKLETVNGGDSVTIDLSGTTSVDYDVSETIRDFIGSAKDRNISVEVINEDKLSQISMTH
jgi:MFS superfamily sulfate permease-like transporter